MSGGKLRVMAYRVTLRDSFKDNGSVNCGICWLPIKDRDELTVDHIIPKSKKGTSLFNNLQPAHKRCNEQKGNRII